jgi:choline dehydrogenase-like flavoprotein
VNNLLLSGTPRPCQGNGDTSASTTVRPALPRFASWDYLIDDDETVRAYLRQSLITYFHPVGMCRIGTDTMAAVDGDLRVHGVTGLRVADAPVMPSIVSANTQAAVLAIAEQAEALLG